jgi:predicted MFS family arabinose efflux permease
VLRCGVAKSSNRTGVLWAAVVLFAINALNFYDRHVAGALTEPIRKEFHLTDTQVGLLGSVFIWLYALFGVPLGRIADTASRKKLLASAIVVWTALTASAAFATNYAMLLISRIGVGLGEAACAPTATSWLGDLFPADKRSRVLALFMVGVPVGGALSFFFSGPVAQAYGWRTAMIIAAAPAVLLVPALLILREPQRGASESDSAPALMSIRQILRIPTLWWIIASGVLLNFNAYAFATFLPAFLSRVYGLSLASSGMAAGVVYLTGGIAGASAAGLLGDFIVRRRSDGRLLVAGGIALLTAPLAWFGVFPPANSVIVAAIFLALSYAAMSSYYGLVYSAIQDFVAPNQRGTAMAVYFMVMYLCGASFGPLLTGRLSDYLAWRAAANAGSPVITESFRAAGLQQAMLVIPVLSVVLAFVLYRGSRTITADMQRRAALVVSPAEGVFSG